MGGTYNSSDHKYDYNLVGITGHGLAVQAHDVANPDAKFRKIPIASDNTSAHVYRTVTSADFELLPTSPAIDKGTTGLGVPATDFYNKPRVAPYDMGAIEFENNGNSIFDKLRSGSAPLPAIEIYSQPSRGSVCIRLNIRMTPGQLAVYRMDGARVRALAPGPCPSRAVWNGADEQGRKVGNGIYQIRYAANGTEVVQTVLFLN
jgi:hypothetical protein